MPLKAIYQQVDSAVIDRTDQTFALAPSVGQAQSPAPGQPVSILALLSPPLLQEQESGKMIVVNGWDILSGLDSTSIIGCLVLPPGTPPAATLELALAGILARRPATAIEQANCWAKALNWLGEEEAARRFGPQLDLLRRMQPSRLLRLLELPPDQASAINSGKLHLPAAFLLLELNRNDRAILFRFIGSLHLSSSNQKKLIEICTELSRRHGTSISEILDRPEPEAFLAEPIINPAQQASRLMAWLGELRLPRLAAASKDFSAFISRLCLPKGVSVEPPLSFEKDDLRLIIEFRNREELEKCWPELQQSLRRER